MSMRRRRVASPRRAHKLHRKNASRRLVTFSTENWVDRRVFTKGMRSFRPTLRRSCAHDHFLFAEDLEAHGFISVRCGVRLLPFAVPSCPDLSRLGRMPPSRSGGNENSTSYFRSKLTGSPGWCGSRCLGAGLETIVSRDIPGISSLKQA